MTNAPPEPRGASRVVFKAVGQGAWEFAPQGHQERDHRPDSKSQLLAALEAPRAHRLARLWVLL